MKIKAKIRRRCKCGCGRITNYGKKYIRGHNGIKNKGMVRSEEYKNKISLALMGNTNAKGGKGKKKSEKHKRNMSLGKMGNTNGRGNKGNERSEKIKKKISLANKGKKRSIETKRKLSESHKGQLGPMLGKKHSIEVRLKLSKSRKKLWQDPKYQMKMKEVQNLKPNKPETALLNLLNKLYPNEYKYVGDFQFWLGGKNPDFMNVNGQKKLIELYGDYWHRNANPQDRIDHFKQYGFNTLVIWEHELQESRLQLRRRLKEFHGG